MLHYYLTWLRTLRREEGQDLAEYALLIALIAIVVATAVYAMGTRVSQVLNIVTKTLMEDPFPK